MLASSCHAHRRAMLDHDGDVPVGRDVKIDHELRLYSHRSSVADAAILSMVLAFVRSA